ncbi:MAG: branched-chain amino acid ABC transporter permease [Actinomycetota bacterium]|jgi:branched-chain amino acid transport system permease protein|nr:branched-chain amino acid ABC transporter permease [Actinomycetota bacterium]
MEIIGQQMVNGITLGGLYALIALGYTLVYGILLLINFAHSEMFMTGAYVGYFTLIGLSKIDFFTSSNVGLLLLYVLAFLAGMIVTGLLGMLTERFAYRPLRNAPRLAPLISAIGVSLFLQNAALLWISSRSIPFPILFEIRQDDIAGVNVSSMQILIVGTTILLLLVLDTFVSKTRVGKAMRAVSQDREAAGLMGVNINYIIALTFFIGPALGGAAGIFSGMYYGSIKYNMGFIPGIKSFTAAVIGGIGNLRGAMLGGFTLGMIEALAAGFISTGYKDVIAFAILILVLVFKPGGLLGESVVEKV